MKFKLKNSGFSLLEIMIAGGMAAGLGLIVLQLNQNAQSVIKFAESNSEVTMFVSELHSIFSDSGNCSETVKGQIGQPITEIKKKFGPNFVVPYKIATPYGNNSFEIESMKTLSEVTGLKLLINIKRLGNSTGVKLITRKIPFNATVVGTTITDCGGGGGSGSSGNTIPVYKLADNSISLSNNVQQANTVCHSCGSCSQAPACPAGYTDGGVTKTNFGYGGPCGHVYGDTQTRKCTFSPVEIGKLIAN